MADLFYGVLVLLLENPQTYQILTNEIREAFSSYEDIVPDKSLKSLAYLQACIEETLRMLPSNNTGLPRISPGAIVDGQYIPKGVSICSIPFSSFRSKFCCVLYTNADGVGSCTILHLGLSTTPRLLP